jgi:hypothetical protein
MPHRKHFAKNLENWRLTTGTGKVDSPITIKLITKENLSEAGKYYKDE